MYFCNVSGVRSLRHKEPNPIERTDGRDFFGKLVLRVP